MPPQEPFVRNEPARPIDLARHFLDRDPAAREADNIAAISLTSVVFKDATHVRYHPLILNLSIGAKLGIASGLGVLLVATMVIVQIRANAAMRDIDVRMTGQQTIARDAVDAKASIAGMQTAVRDFVSPTIRQTCKGPTTLAAG